jgi:hypothetical protein
MRPAREHNTGTHHTLGIVPVSRLRARLTALAVRSSCSTAGTVPRSDRPDSHRPAMPPVSCVFLTKSVGDVYTFTLAAVKSWQYSALLTTLVVDTYFQPRP